MNDPVDEFLNNYPEPIQAICLELRTIVKSATTAGSETLLESQNHLAYSFSGKVSEHILYITPMQNYVRLGFFWGGELPDPSHLLEGTGKRLRHIKIRTVAEANRPEVKALVEAAWENAVGKGFNKNL